MCAGGAGADPFRRTEPEEQLEQQELQNLLNRFLGELTDLQRRVFLRRYWYFDSAQDIARELGLTGAGCVQCPSAETTAETISGTGGNAEMKGMDVIDALADVREDWLEDAAPKGVRKPPRWAKFLSLAACMTLLVAFSGVLILRFRSGQGQQNSVQTPDGTITAASSQEEQSEQEQFYSCFYQLDRDSMEAYVRVHPEVLEQGWSGIDINAAGPEDSGTEIYTTQGDQVLALDAQNGILLIRVVLDGQTETTAVVFLQSCKDAFSTGGSVRRPRCRFRRNRRGHLPGKRRSPGIDRQRILGRRKQ